MKENKYKIKFNILFLFIQNFKLILFILVFFFLREFVLVHMMQEC